MSYPKRHHFIPAMLSKRFTDQEGKLYFFDSRCAERGVRKSTPKNLFVESHLYTTVDSSGNKNVAVEKSLAVLDGKASKVIAKIVNAARGLKTPNLTQDDRAAWWQYFYIQWSRVPDVDEQIASEVVYEEWVSQNLRDIVGKKELNRIIDNAWVESKLNPGKEVHPILMKKGLGIVVSQNPRDNFIVGSHPMVKFAHPGRAHLADPSVEYWFPLASDVAVSPFAGESEKLVLVDDKTVRSINESISKQSTVIAGCSQELVSSFASLNTQASIGR